MIFSTRHSDHPRRRLMVVGLAVTGLLVASFAYAALVHRSPTPVSTPVDSVQGARRPDVAESGPAVAELPDLRATSDPEAFARARNSR